MPEEIDKTNIILTRIKVSPEATEPFVDWQSKLQNVIANFPGFVSFEIVAPSEKQAYWTLVQRFSDASSARAWKRSEQRKGLFNDWSSVHDEDFEEGLSEERRLDGVTEVIVTEVDPKKTSLYRQWLSKIQQAEAKLPGFRGMYVQSPQEGQGRYWLTFLQFDTAENLDKWLASPERQEILKDLDPLIKAFESHRVISPYAGWFGSIAKTGAIPPAWKQTMLVLLVLFPIVMLEFKFLNPLLRGLNPSLATFIGNAISVSLISWPTMPIAISYFRWWLTPQALNRTRINWTGSCIVIAIYLLEIIIFWHLS
jgi:uncharacterized protein